VAISPAGTDLREGLRLRGLFDDPNEFGAFAVPAVVRLCVRWPSLSRALRYTGLGVLLFPIAASLSRGATLTLGVALVVLAAVAVYRHLHRVLNRSVGLIALGTVALVVLLVFAGSASPERVASALIQPYDTVRFAGQLAGMQQALTHPISLGIGPGNYEVLLGHESNQTYLRMLVETAR
jgi:O-antigen ligase